MATTWLSTAYTWVFLFVRVFIFRNGNVFLHSISIRCGQLQFLFSHLRFEPIQHFVLSRKTKYINKLKCIVKSQIIVNRRTVSATMVLYCSTVAWSLAFSRSRSSLCCCCLSDEPSFVDWVLFDLWLTWLVNFAADLWVALLVLLLWLLTMLLFVAADSRCFCSIWAATWSSHCS